MKIIDFMKKGNLVRFLLGADECNDYHGDDWNDTPYEHNAGEVYDEFVKDYIDVVFPFDSVVLEPSEDWHNNGNSSWCKDDMRDRNVPCIVVSARIQRNGWLYDNDFNYLVASDNATKIYFGDDVMSLLKYDCIIVRPPEGFVQSAMESNFGRDEEE